MTVKKLIAGSLLGVFFISCATVSSADSSAFYEVDVMVADQSSGQRLKGFSAAMKEMLVRVSGDESVLGFSELSAAIASPNRYIRGYKYLANSKGAKINRMRVNFIPGTVKDLLLKNALPVWAMPREEVLIWAAVRDGRKSHILKGNLAQKTSERFRAAAQRRGIPLAWPRAADIDSERVTTTDISGGFVKRIVKVSKNYSPQGILLADIKHKGNGVWSAKWRLVKGDFERQWKSPAGSLSAVIKHGLDKVADTYASKYAVVIDSENATNSVTVDVRGINNLERYAEAKKYLEGILTAGQLEVAGVKGSVVTFQLATHSGKSALERAVRLGHKMRIVKSGSGLPQGSHPPASADLFLELL